MKKNIWGTQYELINGIVNYKNDKTSGYFKGFDGIGNSVVDFENVCFAHYSNVLVNNNLA